MNEQLDEDIENVEEETKYPYYITDSGCLGEMPDGSYQLFATEEEYFEYISEE